MRVHNYRTTKKQAVSGMIGEFPKKSRARKAQIIVESQKPRTEANYKADKLTNPQTTAKDTIIKAFIILFFILDVLLLGMIVGREFERAKVRELVIQNLGAEYIDYLINEDGSLTEATRENQVNCILDTKVDRLFDYAGVDY